MGVLNSAVVRRPNRLCVEVAQFPLRERTKEVVMQSVVEIQDGDIWSSGSADGKL